MQNHTILDIENQIENGTAKEIKNAAFVISEEDNIKARFFTLWGSVIKRVYDRSNTSTTYSFVQGENKEIFEATYL